MKKISYQLLFILLLIISYHVVAKANSDYLIHVSKNFDDHPTHLTGYRSKYWITQAPLLRASSLKQIKSSSLCEKNNYGLLILNLEPHLFYNPLMGTLYGSIKTNIYSSQAKPIKSFLTEDENNWGRLDIFPERNVSLLFDKLTSKLLNQIKNDATISEYLKQKNLQPIEGSFCLLLN